MRVFLYILSVWFFLVSCSVFAMAKSAVHEVHASIMMLIAIVALVGGGVIGAINRMSPAKEMAQPKIIDP